MNFYTKVLSRFVSLPELKLEVSFEAPVDSDQAQSKVDETRSGLKELGLGDKRQCRETVMDQGVPPEGLRKPSSRGRFAGNKSLQKQKSALEQPRTHFACRCSR
jgi:hypothetical protein